MPVHVGPRMRPGPARALATLGRALDLAAAVCTAGAGVVHLRSGPEHLTVDWRYGAFFATVGAAQLAGAAALAWWPEVRWLRRALVAGNLAVVAVWAWTRGVGVPLGDATGGREPVGFADLLASGLEVAAAMLAAPGLAWPGRHRRVIDRPVGRRAGAAAVVGVTLVVAPLVAAAGPPPSSPRCAAHLEDGGLGPLVAVDGHSLLPRTTPTARVAMGQPRRVLAGWLVNCARRPVVLERVEPIRTTGMAARVAGFEVGPLPSRPGRHARLPGAVKIPASSGEPTLGLYAEMRPREPGRFSLDSVRLWVREGGRLAVQPFATTATVDVTPAAPPGRPTTSAVHASTSRCVRASAYVSTTRPVRTCYVVSEM